MCEHNSTVPSRAYTRTSAGRCPRARTLAAATATSFEWYSSLNAFAFRPLVTHLVPALLGVTEKIVGLLTICAIESLAFVLWMSKKAQRRLSAARPRTRAG